MPLSTLQATPNPNYLPDLCPRYFEDPAVTALASPVPSLILILFSVKLTNDNTYL